MLKQTKTTILIILIIFSVILVSFEIFLFFQEQKNWPTFENVVIKHSPPPSVPSDWKTYRNEELGIEIKYPKEWGDFKEEIYPEDIFGLDIRATMGSMDDIFVYLRKSELKIDSSFEDYLKDHKEWLKKGKLNVVSEIEEEDLVLDQSAAKKLIFTNIPTTGGGLSVFNVEIYIQKSEFLYMIDVSMDYQKKDTYLPYFNQMLSTFRFIE